jgi:ribosomal protein S18 acetylase RimI-like enzyme
MADMLVGLYSLDFSKNVLRVRDIAIKKASITDKHIILDFVKENFPDSPSWINECERALLNHPTSCYIAVKHKTLIGFSCYDATAKGFFGPIGVKKEYRKNGAGAALLLKTLHAMQEQDYGYAIIGWVAKDAIPFYKKYANATVIKNSAPDKSIYRNKIFI